MNSIRSLITGATVVAAGAGAAAALAVTGSAAAGTATGTATGTAPATAPGTATAPSAGSFTLRAHHGSDASLDLGAKGFSAGDQDLFAGPLTRKGHAAGRFVGTCTMARVGHKSADQLCEFVLHLAHGQITASGTVRAGQGGPGTFALAILGGTGRYRAAAGQIAVTPSNGASFPIAVDLR